MFSFQMIFLLIVLGTFSTAAGQSACRAVERVKDFQMEKYATGTWYEIGRAQNNWEKRGDCVVVTHEKQSDNKINFKIATIIDHKRMDVTGTIDLDKDAKGSGYIDYYSSAYNDSERQNVVPVSIIGIDYDRYVIVYHCHYDETQKKLHNYFWIMTRTPTPDEAMKKEIFDIIKATDVFDMNAITWDHFDEDVCKAN